MKFAAKTDKGMVRETNEDSCNIISGYPGIPVMFIIADGMGGHNSGEVASKTAVDHISNIVIQNPDYFSVNTDIPIAVSNLIKEANQLVYDKSMEHPGNNGMGTTLIVAVVIGRTMYIGHVGDSRLYLIRSRKLVQITSDHSYIEEMVRNGSLTREEADNHPRKNIITRALGCSNDLQIDMYVCEIVERDSFLLCTDGLTNMLSDEEITRIVLRHSPVEACDELVKAANSKGGDDNITVIVIKNV